MPFIEDINGYTPLHYAMGKKPQDLEVQDEERIEDAKDEADVEQNSSEEGVGSMSNKQSVDLFLSELLAHMPLDHHGRGIADVIPSLVREENESLHKYLDKRWITTSQLKKQTRLRLKKMKKNDGYEPGVYVSSIDLWPDERLIKVTMFEDSE